MEETRSLFEDILANETAVAVLHVAIFSAGLWGNFMLCRIITQKRNALSNINFFVGIIAATDALTAFVNISNISMDVVLGEWKLGEILCYIRAYTQTQLIDFAHFAIATVFLIFLFQPKLQLRICYFIAAIIWIVTSGPSVLLAFFSKVSTFETATKNQTFCAVDGSQPSVVFLIEDFYDTRNTLLLIAVLSVYIGCKVMQMILNKQLMCEDKITRMLFVSFLVLQLRWIPFTIWYKHRHKISYRNIDISMKVVNLFIILAQASNPLIVFSMAEDLRSDFVKLMPLFCRASVHGNNYNLLGLES